jgi:hypothetical protein
VCLCERWVWACMWLHRLARACACARRRCGRRHHVRAWVRPPVYIANAHVMYNIYVYISMQKSGHVNGYAYAFLHTRAIACGRRRCANTRHVRECDALSFVRPSIDGTRTYTVYVYVMYACVYIHARLATPTNGSPMRARRTHAPACCVSVRARVCANAIRRPRIRADTCARLPSAWTAAGSARRRSSRRRRSTRTSARGTQRLWRTWLMYAPPFRPGRRATAGGTCSAGSSVRRGPLCAAAPPMRARVCVRSRAGTRMRRRPRV